MRRAARIAGAALLVVLLGVSPAHADGLVFLGLQRDGVGGVDGLKGALSVAISPDGAHVYVAGRVDNAVAAFTRDPATGALVFVEAETDGVGGVDGLDGALSVAISPDGAHVYVASYDDNAVAAFARDAVTGKLAFVEVQKDGVGGIDGLAAAAGVAVSPDAAHVYVASVGDDAVAVFARDPATGALAFVEARKDGVGGVHGLDGATGVTVSPDGAHVYVTSANDHAVAVFARDPVTGALAFVEVQTDGVNGVDGLDYPAAVTVSPDGAHVYVASVGDDAVAVFARDPVTGALAFVEAQKDGMNGVDGLDRAVSVTVSPDGAHVYVASVADGAVAIFRQITCGDGHVDAGEACDDGNQRAGDCCSPICQREAPGTVCTEDGNGCTADVCDAGGTCGHLPAPGLPCADDGSVCTADVCDAAGACSHPGAPAAECQGAAGRRGHLVLADHPGGRDRLAWNWRGTTPGGRAAFGDPRSATGYTLCVFAADATGSTGLQLEAAVPPGGQCGRRACWQRARGGFAYRDRKGRHAGIRTLRLRAGRITVAGRGAQLGLPALPFGADEQVRAQLRRTDGGACWETSFSRAQRRSQRVFRARTD